MEINEVNVDDGDFSVGFCGGNGRARMLRCSAVVAGETQLFPIPLAYGLVSVSSRLEIRYDT